MLTCIVSLIILFCVVLIVHSMVKDKRAGKGICGGDCSHCQAGCIHAENINK